MRGLFAKIKAMADGGISIESVGKSSISRTPGNVTDMSHNWFTDRIGLRRFFWLMIDGG